MANPHPVTAHLKRDRGPGRPKGSKNELTIERIETEIRRLVLFDPIQLFEKSRGKQRLFTRREIADMDPDTRACIASIKVRTENLKGGDGQRDTTVDIKLWSKIDALTLCAKHFKWIDDRMKLEVNVTELEDDCARDASATRRGQSPSRPKRSLGRPASPRGLDRSHLTQRARPRRCETREEDHVILSERTLNDRIQCILADVNAKAGVSRQKAREHEGTAFADRHRTRIKVLGEVARSLESAPLEQAWR